MEIMIECWRTFSQGEKSMVIGFRAPQGRRRFHTRMRDKISRTREYYYSLFTVLVVKIILFIFLWVLFGTTIRVMRVSFKNVSEAWRFVLPVAVAIIAVIIGYHIYKNIMEIIQQNKEMERARKGDSRS